MGFLDNLESNLKNLESADERAADHQESARRREAERAHARAIGPFAEQLKTSPFTSDLLNHATRLGYASRTKVHIAWIGENLRLDARERRLELRPTPDGVTAVFFEQGEEVRRRDVDLGGSAEQLAGEWLNPPAG